MDSLRQHAFLRLLLPLVIGIIWGDFFPYLFSVWVYFAGFSLLLLSYIICWYRKNRWLYGLAVYSFLFAMGFNLMSRQLESGTFSFSNQEAVYKVCIQEKPGIREKTVSCHASLLQKFCRDSLMDCGHQCQLLLYFSKDSSATCLQRGDEVLIYTCLNSPANRGNPDEFDYARYLRRKGISATAYVNSGYWKVSGHNSSFSLYQVALDCRERIVSLYRGLNFSGNTLGILSALTIGDKEELSDAIVETYSVAGASHVLALSGLHIGFLYALLWWLFHFLWKRWRAVKPLLLLLLISLLWGFAFLTGFSSSVVRSVIMFSLLALACLQPEKPLTLNTLSVTAFLMLLYRPAWLFDVGFQLSFAAVTAILFIQPKLYGLWKVENRFLRYIWGLTTVSLAAQLGTAPLVLFYFSRFSTFFLLTNLWVIPMTSLILYSAVFLLCLTPFPGLQQVLAVVVNGLITTQNSVLQWIEGLPFSSVDGIWMDMWEVSLIYMVIGTVCYCCTKYTVKRISFSLFFLLLFAAYHEFSAITAIPRRNITFYNLSNCPVVHCMAGGRKSWLVCADSLSDTSCLYHTLIPYWNHLRLKTPELVSRRFSEEQLSVHDDFLFYAGKSICLLHDGRWKNKESAHLMPIDYLYISEGYKGHLSDLSSLFSIREVVLDASLSAYYQNRFIQECIELGISYISLSAKGSACILL